ncbi:hypothetical protein BC629DRAFT_1598228 [Irpex lacteus]|nr:hypothetical protein BC629DRAFT_1598228 [Irpex lacteus]
MTQVEAADLDELENHKSFVVKLKEKCDISQISGDDGSIPEHSGALGAIAMFPNGRQEVLQDPLHPVQKTDGTWPTASRKTGRPKLYALLEARPIYGSVTQLILLLWTDTLICPFTFGGFLVDMWLAGFFAVFLAIMPNDVVARGMPASSKSVL